MVRAVAAAVAPVLAALLAVLPASGAPPRRAASLRLVSVAPLAVTGRSFGPRETVLLTYLAPSGASRLTSARATRAGRFLAFFRIRVGRCDSFTIRAAGTAGSRAVLQVERSCGSPKGPPERAPGEKPRKPKAG